MKRREFIVPTFMIIFIVLLLTINLFYIKYNNYKSLKNLENAINISIKLSNLVHEVQKERGMSSGYLTSDKKEFTKDLQKQRALTDTNIKEYQKTFNKYKNSLPYIVKNSLEIANKSIKQLYKVRKQIDNQDITAINSIKSYTKINKNLLDPMVYISKKYKIPTLSTYMIAYTSFLYAKENAGIERAIGTHIILSPHITQQDINEFNSLIIKQKTYYDIFIKYTSDNFLKKYNNIEYSQIFKNVQNYRNIILSANQKNIKKINVKDWFNKITAKINKLEELEDYLSQEILDLIKIKINYAWIELLQFIIYTITGLIVILLILYFIIHLIRKKVKLEEMVDKHIILSTTNPKGVITDASTAFCEISGYSKEELIGKPHSIIRHPDMPKSDFKDMWDTIKQGKVWNGVVKNLKKDGGYYIVDAHIEPIFGRKNKITGYIAIRHNITDRENLKEQMEQNARQSQHMIHQSRLAQMGEMISMIAHQWRQPLTAISATSSTIVLKATMDKLDKDSAVKLANKITKYVEHLSITIDDFRNFFKQNKSKQKISLKEIVDSTLDIILVSLENKNITLIKNIHEDLECTTYANEVKQVLLNLIKNAEDILLEVNPTNPTITIESYQPMDKHTVVLTIRDNAGGVPEDIIDKIFDPYFSTKLSKDGTGLGLYMSKTIIEQHCQGTLSVHNDNQGAVFTIELPR